MQCLRTFHVRSQWRTGRPSSPSCILHVKVCMVDSGQLSTSPLPPALTDLDTLRSSASAEEPEGLHGELRAADVEGPDPAAIVGLASCVRRGGNRVVFTTPLS